MNTAPLAPSLLWIRQLPDGDTFAVIAQHMVSYYDRVLAGEVAVSTVELVSAHFDREKTILRLTEAVEVAWTREEVAEAQRLERELAGEAG